MPTQRFLNLKEEKKQAILSAAVHEFSRVPYAAASINQIIKEADISRGSFYTYFEDKDDLMRYMLSGFMDCCREKIFRTLKQEGGNPFAVPVCLLKEAMEEAAGGLGYKMFQNMLTDLSVVNQNQLFGIKGFMLPEDSYSDFVKELDAHVDKERYPLSAETLAYVSEIAVMACFKAMSMYYRKTVKKEQALAIIRNEMRILQMGACSNLKLDPI